MPAKQAKPSVFDVKRITEKLKKMRERSQELKGSSSLCSRVPERFDALFEVLAAMDAGERQRADELAFLNAFEAFYKVMAYQKHYWQILHRLATSLRVVNEVYQAHGRIDSVYEQLVGVVEAQELSSGWREHWDDDRKEQESWFSAAIEDMDDQTLVSQINNPVKLAEVLAIMTTQRQVRVPRPPNAVPAADLTASPGMLGLITRVQDLIETYKGICMPHDMYKWYIEKSTVAIGGVVPVEEGTFGILYRGTWDDVYTGTFHDKVAIKRLESQLEIPADDAVFSRELSVWSTLEHPNILKMHGAHHTSRPRFFVCEYADGGNLLQFFEDAKNRDLLWDKFGQAAAALQYLHSKGIEHGGLKCHNILMTSNGVVKLSDFGLAVVRDQSRSISKRAESDRTRWKAPEQLCQSATPVDYKKADVYSLGLCIVEAVTGVTPFGTDGDEEVIEKKLGGVPIERPDKEFNDSEWKLVARMTANDPNARPYAKELVGLMAALNPSVPGG